MANDPQTKNPEEQTENNSSSAAANKIRRRSKPSLEGINSPKVSKETIFVKKPALTEEERELIAETQDTKKPEPKLLPNSVSNRLNRKPSILKNFIITIIVLAILGFGGYKAYLWYFVGGKVPADITNIPAQTNADAPGAWQAPTSTTASNVTTTQAVSSTTPFGLAGGSIASSTASSTPSPKPTITPTPTAAHSLTVNSTPTGYLNVRSTPSTSGTQIAQVHPGESYPYTTSQNGWYQITLPTGTTGWVTGQYVTPQ